MRALPAIAARELRRAWGSGSLWLPIVFYLAVATLFPFAVGPDRALLLRTGGGVIWIAALLAALLPIERLVGPDLEAGVVDQWAIRAISEELVGAGKLLGHWLGFAPPLILATVVAGALMGLTGEPLLRLLIALALASPGLAALSLMAAALTAGARGVAAMAGLLVLPLAVPLLIFGAGALGSEMASALRWLSALSLLLAAAAPFVVGAAMRAAREG